MPTSLSDPVTAVVEAEATGEIADLFADIRNTLGVPVVNLIWRHLATVPGGLAWTWVRARPLYISGDISAHAKSLKQAIDIPNLPGITASTLAAIGLSDDELSTIATVVASYERSNAQNLVAMGALLADLDNVTATQSSILVKPGIDESVQGSMPELQALNALPPAIRALIDDLNRIGHRDTVMPTMYRHLAYWPGFLAQLHVLLKPLDADGRLETMIVTAAAEGVQRGATLRDRLGTPATELTDDARKQVRAGIALFIDEPISKMTAIGGLVDAAMP